MTFFVVNILYELYWVFNVCIICLHNISGQKSKCLLNYIECLKQIVQYAAAVMSKVDMLTPMQDEVRWMIIQGISQIFYWSNFHNYVYLCYWEYTRNHCTYLLAGLIVLLAPDLQWVKSKPYHQTGEGYWEYSADNMSTPWVGVTKAPFVSFSASKIFDLAKVTVRFFESHSYLTGIASPQLSYGYTCQI